MTTSRGGTLVEHMPYHLKVKSLNLATVTVMGREKNGKKLFCI
jgi:hypothetical protein